jgi:phosphoglycerate dehydrogenase-like enzyme
MDTILIQHTLDSNEIAQLQKECHNYNITTISSNDLLPHTTWPHVEIFYGHRLNQEHFALAKDLHWIHCPSQSLSLLCLKEIKERGDIIITTSIEENLRQIGEFVMGGILNFAKQFLYWNSAKKNPDTLWDDENRRTMWTLQDRTMLQIGLGKIGSEIARQAQQMKLNVIGVQSRISFHPHCDKTVALKDFREKLPEADIVCVCLARDQMIDNLLTMAELKMMKEDSILIILGPHTLVNAEDLAKIASTGKLRGILFDAWHHPVIPTDSLLWKIPQLLITPEVSFRPVNVSKQAFQLFHYNLRHFMCGNFSDMRNRIDLN